MGYTHYVYRLIKDHDQETWDNFIKDCKKLYKNMPRNTDTASGCYSEYPLIINGCFQYKLPQFNKDKVYFNGGSSKERFKYKDDKKYYWKDELERIDLGHETFILKRKAWKNLEYRKNEPMLFSFCKTARKPYDLMVCACLILYKYYFKDEVIIHSDGGESDWTPALEFVQSICKYNIIFKDVIKEDIE